MEMLPWLGLKISGVLPCFSVEISGVSSEPVLLDSGDSCAWYLDDLKRNRFFDGTCGDGSEQGDFDDGIARRKSHSMECETHLEHDGFVSSHCKRLVG